MKTLIPITLIMMIAAALYADGNCEKCDKSSCCKKGAATAIDVSKLGELSKADRDFLVTQLHDEHLAFDLYTAFGKKWALRPFENIRASEARHQQMVSALADAWKLEKPESKPGVFSDPEVQALYDRLAKQGAASEVGALKAAAFVEETDLTQIRKVLAATKNPQIQQTFAQLDGASQNHLRAFVRNLEMRGVKYTPQVLEAEAFAAIIDAEGGCGGGKCGAACGSGGKGQGKGFGRGRS